MGNAGIHSDFGTLPGRRRGWDVEPNTNLMVQDPTNWITANTGVTVGDTFTLNVSLAAGAGHLNTAIYTCPAGWEAQVLDMTLTPVTNEANATYQPKVNTTAICTAVVSAVAGVPGRPVAGWVAANGLMTEDEVLYILDAGGSNTVARTGYVTMMRTA